MIPYIHELANKLLEDFYETKPTAPLPTKNFDEFVVQYSHWLSSQGIRCDYSLTELEFDDPKQELLFRIKYADYI